MLLEEALAGNANSNNNPTTSSSPNNLSPHDEALAILSFVRDELPAGGTAAEKRFVNLLPLIVNRIFGEWNVIANNPADGSSPGSSRRSSPAASPSVATSPGGSTYSSPVASSPNATEQQRDYRHAEGGWLGLFSSPQSQQQQRGGVGGGVGNSNNRIVTSTPSSTTTSSSLENDPISRLLRAPRSRKYVNNNNNNNSYYEPTLVDALSVESIHRPLVRFKFPLAGLSSSSSSTGGAMLQPLVDDWKVCFWRELEVESSMMMEGNTRANASSGASNNSRGSFGSTAVEGDTKKDGEKSPPLGTIGKENATRILLHLLSGGPKDQLELRSYFQQTYHQQHHEQKQQHGFGTSSTTTSTFASPLNTRMASSSGGSGGYSTPRNNRGNTNINNGPAIEPNLELTMLEYYLFLFVRFPLASTAWVAQLEDQQRRRRQYGNRRMTPPYGQRVYSYLFSSYMNYYLGHGKVYNMLGVGADCFDEAAAAAATNMDMTNNLSSPTTAAMMDRTSELFLRLLIEFWIEGSNIAPTTPDAIARYRRVRACVSSSSQSAVANPSLRDSLELAQPSNINNYRSNTNSPIFTSPPSQVQIGVLNLVRHLVSDKSVRELVKSVSGICQTRQREDYRGSGAATPPLVNDGSSSGGGGAPLSNNSNNQAVVPWCLPPAMTATQPSIFNYIRLGLACGAIHDRSSIFHRALETWLVWLEPWNYVMKRRVVPLHRSGSGGGSSGNGGGGGRREAAGEFLRNAAATVSSAAHHRSGSNVEFYPSYVQPKPTSPSTYSAQWEAYIVSNAHFYTVPLAIFLKRARELDFSSTVEYPRSLTLVQRVLRIYSKSVVNILNSVLYSRADGLSMSLFIQHGTNMGAFCPPNHWKLVECQIDATNLMEEVFGQFAKRRAGMDLFDRIDVKLNALFDGKIGGSEEAALEALLSQVRYLVNLPLDYQVLPDETNRTARGFGLWRLLGLGAKETVADATSENLLVPQRGADGKLTDLGRQQLHAGLCKCNPMDVHYIGDPMLARVKSYEIPALVELTIRLSNYLNGKLGLVVPPEGDDAVDGTAGGDDFLLKHYREMEQYQKITFRVNLRFLADSRNIIFGAIVWWVIKALGGLFAN